PGAPEQLEALDSTQEAHELGLHPDLWQTTTSIHLPAPAVRDAEELLDSMEPGEIGYLAADALDGAKLPRVLPAHAIADGLLVARIDGPRGSSLMLSTPAERFAPAEMEHDGRVSVLDVPTHPAWLEGLGEAGQALATGWQELETIPAGRSEDGSYVLKSQSPGLSVFTPGPRTGGPRPVYEAPSLPTNPVFEGAHVTVTVTVTNVGDEVGDVLVPLFLDGERIQARTIEGLAPQQSANASFLVSFDAGAPPEDGEGRQGNASLAERTLATGGFGRVSTPVQVVASNATPTPPPLEDLDAGGINPTEPGEIPPGSREEAVSPAQRAQELPLPGLLAWLAVALAVSGMRRGRPR
ncbi:MAG: CARDB domain-containing protein, partial [Candidatus Thermoplasmatota archaeon]|nr:CARDB domain-containing protein [Candidatus Thermoplasmatota archaeon]